MKNQKQVAFSYFPGCSLATSARENNLSLLKVCENLGITLVELADWNCCGSSSAHSIDPRLAFHLASRNLFLAPPDRPLLTACPSCNLRLRQAHFHLRHDLDYRKIYRDMWGRDFNPDLKIVHFFELFSEIRLSDFSGTGKAGLRGLKFVPYYGCMLMRPPAMRREKNFFGLMENILSKIGAAPFQWSCGARCCGTFLSAAKPKIVTDMVNTIIQNAIHSGAECIVTACAMCHLNLELRCTRKEKIPIFHFSELLSLAMGSTRHTDWFSRHLIDPVPLLKEKGLIS